MDYDFCGWVTKNDLKCADGKVIRILIMFSDL